MCVCVYCVARWCCFFIYIFVLLYLFPFAANFRFICSVSFFFNSHGNAGFSSSSFDCCCFFFVLLYLFALLYILLTTRYDDVDLISCSHLMSHSLECAPPLSPSQLIQEVQALMLRIIFVFVEIRFVFIYHHSFHSIFFSLY